MRLHTHILMLALLAALPFAAAAEIYKYVDSNGVIRYTDKPPSKDAKPVELPPLQTYGNNSAPREDVSEPEPSEPTPATPAAYDAVELIAPTADQVFNTGSGSIGAAANVSPELQAGHSLVFLVDGLPFPAGPGQTTAQLTGLLRGTHSLQAVVLDGASSIQAQSNPINFHMHQPSTLQPGFDPTPGSAPRPSSGPATPTAPGKLTRPPIVP